MLELSLLTLWGKSEITWEYFVEGYFSLSLNIFIVENAHYKQSNNTVTQKKVIGLERKFFASDNVYCTGKI